MAQNVSIVIPLFNSANLIPQTIHAVKDSLSRAGWSSKIILYDDGSQDQSFKIAKNLTTFDPYLEVFGGGRNNGLGFALRQLILQADGDYVVYCDCDLPFGASIIPTMLNQLTDCDIVVASRYMGKRAPVSFARRCASRSYHGLCRLLFGIRVVDIGSGTVAFRGEAIKNLNLKCRGFGIHAEIFVKAQRKGLRVLEMPFVSRLATTSSFSILRHGGSILIETMKLWLGLI